MARGLFRRLFGRPEPPPEVAAAVAALSQLAAEHPTLAGPATALRDILPTLFEEDIPAVVSAIDIAKLAGGVPLLHGETITFDRDAFRRRFCAACRVLESHQGADAARQVRRAVEQSHLDPCELLRAVLSGSAQEVHAAAERCGGDPNLTATLLRLSAFPTLVGLRERLPEARWERGCCPVCGSWPLLGELRGLEQLQFLRCGWCASDWPFPRLQCPYCETRDHHQLGYLSVEGKEDTERAATCDECRGYVKLVATLSALPPLDLLVRDVATLPLDLIAAGRGYTTAPF